MLPLDRGAADTDVARRRPERGRSAPTPARSMYPPAPLRSSRKGRQTAGRARAAAVWRARASDVRGSCGPGLWGAIGLPSEVGLQEYEDHPDLRIKFASVRDDGIRLVSDAVAEYEGLFDELPEGWSITEEATVDTISDHTRTARRL